MRDSVDELNCAAWDVEKFRSKLFSARGTHGSGRAFKKARGRSKRRASMGQQSSPDLSLVLVVDDDEEVLQVTADILKTLGYRVFKARTGLEAVEQLERNAEISVLLTDIRMPDIGGEGLAGIATTWRPDIRVVLTSRLGRPHGDSEFLPKPYRATDLIRVFPPQPLHTLRS